jgi:hypothetical protein
MSGSLIDAMRAMPTWVMEGVSDDGFARIVGTIVEAECAHPAAFRSSLYADGDIRRRLRIVAALLPSADIARTMMLLVANPNADLDDFHYLVKDRVGETSLAELRHVISLLRDNCPARKIADLTTVGLPKIDNVSRFLGTRESRIRRIQGLAWEFAVSELNAESWLDRRRDLKDGHVAVTEYWRELLRAHRQLTVFDEASLGLVRADVELADLCGVSESTARKYLADARSAVREVAAS